MVAVRPDHKGHLKSPKWYRLTKNACDMYRHITYWNLGTVKAGRCYITKHW